MQVCHSCFLLRSGGGTTILIDPYFGGPFRWKGHDEKHVSPEPAAGPEEMKGLSGIVITHDHPDHCQPDALYKIMMQNRCGLWGPSGIYRRAVEVGIDNRRVTKIDAFQRFTVRDVQVLALPNKGSEDTKPCMRMSYLFSCDGLTVFHGGDSHGPSPAWSGHVEGVALALLWPNHIERSVSFVKPFSVAVMHCDKFDPGDFLCGYDAEEIRGRLRKRSRGGRVLAPAVGEWFWPERPPEEELRRLREKIGGRRRRDRGRRDRGGRGEDRGSRPQREDRPGSGNGGRGRQHRERREAREAGGGAPSDAGARPPGERRGGPAADGKGSVPAEPASPEPSPPPAPPGGAPPAPPSREKPPGAPDRT
jgi:hypothetical protein